MLFGRKNGEPYQISINARALTDNQELFQVEGKRLQSTNRQQQRAMLEGLAQGSTIDNDKKIPGSVIFVDASLKCRDIPDAQDHQTTGIGIFIRAEIARRSCSIKIQAIS